jgi:hypothetical protein
VISGLLLESITRRYSRVATILLMIYYDESIYNQVLSAVGNVEKDKWSDIRTSRYVMRPFIPILAPAPASKDGWRMSCGKR